VRVIVELSISAAARALVDSDIVSDMRRQEVAKARDSVRASLLGTAHSIVREYQELPFIALEVGVDALRTLESLSGLVIKVVPDRLHRPFLSESVPLVQADKAWAGDFSGVPFTGNGMVVAILDTGVDKNHPFLTGKVVEEACFSSNSARDGATSLCPGRAASSFAPGSGMPCSAAIDGCEHGTHVAGIAAGTSSTFSGVARNASIMAVQIFTKFENLAVCGSADPCVRAFSSDILAGLERVYNRRAAHNFAAVNMSLGGGKSTTTCDSDINKPIIDLLRAADIPTVIASGNDGFTDGITFPSCVSTAVSVGSTGDGSFSATADVVSAFSNSASFLSLLAPGAVINSSVPGTGFDNRQGTSMATPHVTGAFALLKEAGPDLTVTQMLDALQNTGTAVLDARNGITTPRIRILDALFAVPDATPPAAIADLKVNDATTQTTIDLSWTAPGDDGSRGTATAYDVRYSTVRLNAANWSAATRVNGEPAPMMAGSLQNITVSNLVCNRTYYFGIESADEAGNFSALSNIATAKTAPCNKLAVNPKTLPAGEAGVPYNSGVFTITGLPATVAPFNVQIDPATVPPGLSYNGSQAFTGTPTLAKSFAIVGTITDAVGSVLKARFNLKIAKPIQITTTALKSGRLNVPYSATPKAKNGVKAYTWTAQLDSALPSGSTFTFDPGNGKISILATAASAVNVIFQVTDAAGGSDTQILPLTFN
jgi:subtilisin family serine protease